MRIATGVFVAVCGFLVGNSASAADPTKRFVYPGLDGRLVYDLGVQGDRVPDFSHCGYSGGGVSLPNASVRVVVPVVAGDATRRIQAAIDYVSSLPADVSGVRGAVLLLAGRHEVSGFVRVRTGGVVVRGQGAATVLVATGLDRRTLIQVRGKEDCTLATARSLADARVPVGATRVRVADAAGLKVGDAVRVEHPATKEWIAAVGMNRFPTNGAGSYLDWRPHTLDLRWDRVVTHIDGDTLTLDAPLTTALDASHGGGTVRAYQWPGRVRQVGVENLRIESAFDPANPHDENHAWGGIGFENAQDCWVRRVSFSHLAGSAVAVWESCSRVTVEDCESTQPVSEVGGYRRHTFFTAGQQTLFRRCRASEGRHDFAVGYAAAGPNAFVHCRATDATGFSGPIESWASGTLFDNVAIDGGGLSLTNRETDHQGVGWAAANSVLWQCSAPLVTCRTPPTAQNWAIGCWGQFVGDGHWRQMNEFVKPDSLYQAQLADRLGKAEPTSRDLPTRSDGVPSIDDLVPVGPAVKSPAVKPLALTNGVLATDGKAVFGDRSETTWWRGSVNPARVAEFGRGLTRFVPGREGPGFTDDLDQLTDEMRAGVITVLEHHWGLWYDRRRDDHQMVRRADGEVWPPFYEQPWARSGRGRAWDGLSRYDLTKFNPWYFARLKAFADFAGQKGLVLVQQMYFQHNVLEAAAHWADFPWRPANCLQATGFPEPPEYAGGKRVFMAEAFYDVSHPVRRDLHRAYIRHCLYTLGPCPNVVFQLGEEFSGPQSFVEFWLDCVAEWQKETGTRVLVGLSAPKDVQDAILADPKRSAGVSVIDLRYWWYAAGGEVYAPKGGENLAPRQHLREWKGPKGRSAESVARAVREYRVRFPDKAVTASYDGADGWAVLAAGGSLPALPAGTDPQLLAAVSRMKPADAAGLPKGAFALSDAGRDYLVWAPIGGRVSLDLTAHVEPFTAAWLDPKTGAAGQPRNIAGGQPVELTAPAGQPAVLWVRRK
ncbi:DUF6298 domain-containing protein [Limnoglobus roseus]|uniref:DUF6298 domain-containing protein n=1 Tax=Limnoglobus roseus TaxID=2598579 RepID=UPI0011EAC161|nr:DUF6298 domain-containing protein [Limnoglobus roseus]